MSADTPPVPPTPWPAPRAGAPVRGEVVVPASKSLTNRLLLLAALADGPCLVINALESRDSALMLAALEQLGAGVEHISDPAGTGEQAVRITPLPLDQAAHPSAGHPSVAHAPEVRVDCGLAGTVMRFLPAVAALTGRTVHFDGDPEARVRPMGAVLQGLAELGVAVTGDAGSAPGGSSKPASQAPSTLPFTLHSPGGLDGGEAAIDASASSQFVSGLLLAAPRMTKGLTLRHSGTSVPSLEHVEMTMTVLEQLGVTVSSPQPFTWRVEPGPIPAFTVRVEPDLSNAGPFLCAAAVTGGEVVMRGWPKTSTQIGRRWTRLLADFGAAISTTEEAGGETLTLTVRGPQRLTTPGTVDGTAELTPTVAALAALCEGETTFTSVAHLRGHETDRIAALAAEIRRLGGEAEETDDGFRVLSPISHGGLVRSYADHRMATFAAVLGLVVDEVEVEDIGCTAKTMPTFPQLWQDLVSSGHSGDAETP
ncbi:3-phosphoshikimate 1-carboxyvinyltransferase [Nesterenkonia xinjiangensis]|nr:3-phosphoshikimate 1-carboxyvinyltransferase [Nesterenkonia xinjiangensis]